MSSDTSHTCATISRMCSQTNTKLCLHRKMFQLFAGNLEFDETMAGNINEVIEHCNRFLVVKYGKWNDRVCVAKNLVNEKRLFLYFVPRRSRANENFER